MEKRGNKKIKIKKMPNQYSSNINKWRKSKRCDWGYKRIPNKIVTTEKLKSGWWEKQEEGKRIRRWKSKRTDLERIGGESMVLWPKVNERLWEGNHENISCIDEKCGIIHSRNLRVETMCLEKQFIF